jgi:hypothetical protein
MATVTSESAIHTLFCYDDAQLSFLLLAAAGGE